jgi:hypothetical protein
MWVDKITHHIYSTPEYNSKVSGWIRQVSPHISDQLVGREIDRVLIVRLEQRIQISDADAEYALSVQ